MHLYVFGSICRGDVSVGSDVDLLAIVEGHDSRFDPNQYSIYSYERINEIWQQGNPFAWHLSIESKLIYSINGLDYLKTLGCPQPYKNAHSDCQKFYSIFLESKKSLIEGGAEIFDLSTIFLAIRNIATCFSLGKLERADFSRSSALRLGDLSIKLPENTYSILERARLLCTRGFGDIITASEIESVKPYLGSIGLWMQDLVNRSAHYE